MWPCSRRTINCGPCKPWSRGVRQYDDILPDLCSMAAATTQGLERVFATLTMWAEQAGAEGLRADDVQTGKTRYGTSSLGHEMCQYLHQTAFNRLALLHACPSAVKVVFAEDQGELMRADPCAQ